MFARHWLFPLSHISSPVPRLWVVCGNGTAHSHREPGMLRKTSNGTAGGGRLAKGFHRTQGALEGYNCAGEAR